MPKIALAFKGDWIIIDEIQKLPILLDEVHSLIVELKGKKKFALTGSSARKLKQQQANLLAGRAITKKMFSLTINEISSQGKISLDQTLIYGMLPESVVQESDKDRRDFLNSYVETYLQQEIQQETRVRNLLGFHRFLQVSAIMNAQKVNLSNIARDCGIARSTVQGHFQILIDTLIGRYLAAYLPHAKLKESHTPKFYFFDPGVVTAIKGFSPDKIEDRELGFLFETFILNELDAVNSYSDRGARLSYWASTDKDEVDFIWQLGKKIIGIEVKSTEKWRPEYHKNLEKLIAKKAITKGYGIYRGNEVLQVGQITVYPYQVFLREIYTDQNYF